MIDRQQSQLSAFPILANQSECVMLDTKDLLEYAERCRTLADLSRVPQVSQRLRVLAQSYTEQAQDIEHHRAAEALLGNEKTTPALEAIEAPGLVSGITDQTPPDTTPESTPSIPAPVALSPIGGQ